MRSEKRETLSDTRQEYHISPLRVFFNIFYNKVVGSSNTEHISNSFRYSLQALFLLKFKILLQEALVLRDLNDNIVKVEYSDRNIRGFALLLEEVNSLTNIQLFGGFVVEDVIGILKTCLRIDTCFYLSRKNAHVIFHY